MLPLCFAVTVQVVRVQGRHSLRHAHYAPCQADRVNTALGSTRRATARLHYAVHQHQAIQQVNNRHESLLYNQPTHSCRHWWLAAGHWTWRCEEGAVANSGCRQWQRHWSPWQRVGHAWGLPLQLWTLQSVRLGSVGRWVQHHTLDRSRQCSVLGIVGLSVRVCTCSELQWRLSKRLVRGYASVHLQRTIQFVSSHGEMQRELLTNRKLVTVVPLLWLADHCSGSPLLWLADHCSGSPLLWLADHCSG
jgi:hypothetical protein